ncbi:MAG: glutamate-cysteine ligase family protein, partial [Sciscionella sp.]
MMTAVCDDTTAESSVILRDREQAVVYVASVCFKHGPPTLLGVELEWTLHHAADPSRELDIDLLAAALGEHAPPTVRADSPHDRLPGGSLVTVEPGGQVELSSTAHSSPATVHRTMAADIATLRTMLADFSLVLGSRALDPHRRPTRVLHTPRYDAMQAAFDPVGDCGLTMMCNSAGLQVCVDAGQGAEQVDRWNALHLLGPVCVALFANSPSPTGWVSGRQRVTMRTDPRRSRPSHPGVDPARAWARRVLNTPVICQRSAARCWVPERRFTFADWIDGAVDPPPTLDDLRYHLSTMFTPVRPQGYYEIRYLDAQPDGEWLAPFALITSLMAEHEHVQEVSELAAPARGRWLHAA